MTEDRFLELAEAYGGEIARWPAAERAAAEAFAAEPRRSWPSALLGAERRLDALLDGQSLRRAQRAPCASGSSPRRAAARAAGRRLALADRRGVWPRPRGGLRRPAWWSA